MSKALNIVFILTKSYSTKTYQIIKLKDRMQWNLIWTMKTWIMGPKTIFEMKIPLYVILAHSGVKQTL
jgi:hypothetical protein